MNHRYLALALLILPSVFAIAQADAIFDSEEPLQVDCHYSGSRHESVTLKRASVDATASNAHNTTKRFQKNGQSQDATFLLAPDDSVECIFPSGNRVRAKVGSGDPFPYGECGASADIFESIWVNKRKIVTKDWFSGHCRSDKGLPDVSYNITMGDGVSIEKCHTAIKSDTQDNGDTTKPDAAPLSVCIEFPALARFPLDSEEYPREAKTKPKVGDIQLSQGTHPVCAAIQAELKASVSLFGDDRPIQTKGLSAIAWQAASIDLPDTLSGGREGVFDFDNDGTLDRVFIRDFESRYHYGSALLVQHGRSTTELKVDKDLTGKNSSFLPCQMDASKPSINACSPFTEANDDSLLVIAGQGKGKPTSFRTRYATPTPFQFEKASYLAIRSNEDGLRNLVAIIKPLPNREFESLCLLRQVEPNF